jgi:hypothetical protein
MYGSRYQAQGICEKLKKEKPFLLHFQTVDGRNFATATSKFLGPGNLISRGSDS